MCRVVHTLLVDEEAIYAPRQGNDRLLLGLKSSLNQYELDLFRQRSLAACHQKARRGELIVSAPLDYIKTDEQKREKDHDRRVQQAIALIFTKFAELTTVRQTLLRFLNTE
jgi:DNA invertase Pin-like site-specific DNA recombinase